MIPYALETWTPEEAALLRRYFTDVAGPVFAVVNLPEVVKGALFARYSRSSKSLRRLFLDEFVEDLESTGPGPGPGVGVGRAEQLYERVLLEYGDDSVAQLGGVHLACEQVSNVLSKVLERSRLMAYLEQSTRYVRYDSRLADGRYRYYRDPEVLSSPVGARYIGDMDRMFDHYGELASAMTKWLSRRYPKAPGDSDVAWRRAVRARALDAVRGVLPAGTVSNLGIYASAQSYELLLAHLRSHPLPEARAYGEMILGELRKVIPAFLTRVDRPDRGGAWSAYLAATRDATAFVTERFFAEGALAPQPPEPAEAAVRLVDYDPEGEEKVLAAILFASSELPEDDLRRAVSRLSAAQRAELVAAYVGERANRRHRPGRAFERTGYRFEIVSDYGVFRDLQRHRMLTIEWQPLTPSLGWQMPAELAEAGLGQLMEAAMSRSAALYEALVGAGFGPQAPYALAMAFRTRYVMHMSAREAMHVCELRSGPQGHPAYRAIAQEMHRLIAEQAGHRAIAAAMAFVDHSPGAGTGEEALGRLAAERRAEERREQAARA